MPIRLYQAKSPHRVLIRKLFILTSIKSYWIELLYQTSQDGAFVPDFIGENFHTGVNQALSGRVFILMPKKIYQVKSLYQRLPGLIEQSLYTNTNQVSWDRVSTPMPIRPH